MRTRFADLTAKALKIHKFNLFKYLYVVQVMNTMLPGVFS